MKQKWWRIGQSGLSLVELVIGIAIIGIVALLLHRFLLSSTILYGEEKKEIKLEIELQEAADVIGDEMLECRSIDNLPDPDGLRYLLRTSQSEASILVLKEKTLSLRRIKLTEDMLRPGDESDLDLRYDEKILELAGSGYDDVNQIVLSDKVKAFSITPEKIDGGVSNKIYRFSITLVREAKEAECSKQITLRNHLSF